MRYRLTFKQGAKIVARVEGPKDVDPQFVTLADVERVFEVEAFLERLTGCRVHIEWVVGATSKPTVQSQEGSI